jgi:hypothetical protein
MRGQRYPTGWDEHRVSKLIADLEAMTEDDWAVADEAAIEGEEQVLISVPRALLPEVRKLLAAWRDQGSGDPADKPS